MHRILRIDASMRQQGSVTRDLADKAEAQLRASYPQAEVIRRDLADGLPLIDETWIGANFTDPAARDEVQAEALALSDALIEELRHADILLLAVPMYNFGVPAAFKLWVDQIARARETFKYTEAGPVGLLDGKRAIIVTASGGTETDGPVDYATPYIRHVLSFVGISETTTIAASKLMVDADGAVSAAIEQIETLAA